MNMNSLSPYKYSEIFIIIKQMINKKAPPIYY